MRTCLIIFLLGLLFIPAFTQTNKPKKPTPSKAVAAKPKPAATPKKTVDETAEWEKALAVADANERIAAIKSFLNAFPKTKKLNLALETLVTLRADIGNERLLAGDLVTASDFFKAAAAETPKPVPEELFNGTLSKFSSNLFFRGAQLEAVEIAKLLEERADTNAAQLLNIAAFYLSVEMGSDARRVAENVIRLTPDSSAAFQTLGLANRVDFQIEQSAVAYAKALELEPDSITARRGLAEMNRSLGKPEEAETLYHEILAKDAANQPAKTGLILAQFDGGKRADAETALAASLTTNPDNVILLAGVAYWYAAHNEADKAVEFGRKAITAEPRFIWSYLALARGLMLQNKPLDAERTLLAARQYGNFPTLEYEIATTRFAAGFYREAAETLAKSFAIKDGSVSTYLGGRVKREAASFSELVAFERRASIFAPTAADDASNSGKLLALLEFSDVVNVADVSSVKVSAAADKFVGADDTMKIHRQLFAASQLLNKRLEPAKIIELTKAAVGSVSIALDLPTAAAAVFADELYRSRSIAAERDEYIQMPNIPRSTLSAILRGRIEELSGAALLQMGNQAESIVRFKRAISVLPAESVWWRSSNWRLGSAFEAMNKNPEALDAYYKSYKSGAPDPIKYSVIESLYRRINGSTDGLEIRIGRNPLVVRDDTVAEKTESIPGPTSATSAEPKPDFPTAITVKIETPPTPTPDAVKFEPRPETAPLPTLSGSSPSNDKPKELFPPVVITIPSPDGSTPRVADKSNSATIAIKPCTVTVSEETITLKNNGTDLAIIVGTEEDDELTSVIAVSSVPDDLDVHRELIADIKGRALFVVRSISTKTGDFQIKFEMPCGKKVVFVKVI